MIMTSKEILLDTNVQSVGPSESEGFEEMEGWEVGVDEGCAEMDGFEDGIEEMEGEADGIDEG